MTQEQTLSLEFKTEVQQLLNILANSLYTEREIFLRELVSNASDALHRIQFEMLTNRDVRDPEAALEIRLEVDGEANTLTITDTGIGMTRAEIIENLGTIAHSGAAAFLKSMEEGQRPADIIGQFGVGFYSVFMVADHVQVTTRSFQPNAEAWTWTSHGESTYTLQPADKETRGTEIIVYLKEDASEFSSNWRLEQIIKKHSNFVSFPITLEERVLNQQTALWREAPQEVEPERYDEFYRQITLEPEKPLRHIHVVTDAPVNIRSLLFIPGRWELGPLQLRTDYGLKLYSRKILIQEHNKDLLPEYLHFVEGVVDSEDIPLNISRETIQSNRAVRQIQRALTKRVLKELQDLAEEDAETYDRFWRTFGAFIKQGVATNPVHQEELVDLLRFPSSRSGGALVSLDEYVGRMPEAQEKLYFILGEDMASVAASPHLDYFKQHNVEVLYMVDPLDGFMIQMLQTYKEKPLQNVDAADLTLPEIDEPGDKAPETLDEAEFDAVVARFREVLGDRVKEVRASHMLRDSPCRLVSPESGPERELQRVRRLLEKDFEAPPKIIELNRKHPLIRNLAARIEATSKGADPVVDATIEQLFANLLILEGSLPNPSEMVPRILALLEAATRSQ
ncbi:MAG: molecular chaperone HtpG [Anaerolineae bacterium]|nr:molecular chaperone HtpG [Anaerolineae bacterium]